MQIANETITLRIRTVVVGLLALIISGCSPVYQLSEAEDELAPSEIHEVPALHGAFFDVVGSYLHLNDRRKINKQRIIDEALRESAAPSLDKLTMDHFADCTSWTPKSASLDGNEASGAKQHVQRARNTVASPTKGNPDKNDNPPSGCFATHVEGTPAISHPIAAVIRAAALECVFWTYNENTTAINQTTIANALGLAAVAGSVLKATGSSQTAAAAAGVAGVTALGANLQGSAPKVVSSTAQAVINEGFKDYPVLQLRINWEKDKNLNIDNFRNKAFFISVLSEMWDVAGSACPAGVLKGASWFNDYEDVR